MEPTCNKYLKSNKKCDIYLNIRSISGVIQKKYLGNIIDEKLTQEANIENIIL